MVSQNITKLWVNAKNTCGVCAAVNAALTAISVSAAEGASDCARGKE